MYTECSNQSEIMSRETSHVASFAPRPLLACHCSSTHAYTIPDDYYTAPPSCQCPMSKFIHPPVVYVWIPISGYSVIGITDPTYTLQPAAPVSCDHSICVNVHMCVRCLWVDELVHAHVCTFPMSWQYCQRVLPWMISHYKYIQDRALLYTAATGEFGCTGTD